MSLGIYGLLNMATSTLYANSAAIELTGHNISNVNTEGYSRQDIIFESTAPVRSSSLFIGRGVSVAGVKATEDRFLNYQIYKNSSLLGNLEARARNASPLEEIFNESQEEGLSAALNSFFSAMGDLASAPEGQAERTAVLGVAESLVSNFHMVDSRLEEIADSANNEVKYTLQEINSLAHSIASLNQKILNMEGAGQNAYDYRSQRAQLMQSLSEKIDYSYFEDDNGTVTIMIGKGKPLVEGNNYGSLQTQNNPANNNYLDVYFQDINGNQVNITSSIKGGALRGVLDIRDVTVADLRSELDNLAYTLAEQFNATHSAGYTLNGTTGVNFFEDLGGAVEGAASRLAVSSDIRSDVNNIAAALTNAPGDNQNALALSALQDGKFFNGGTWTFQDQYSATVASIGAETSRVTNEYEQQEQITTQVKNSRESVAGVSIEEEMANLLKYQEVYQAAARLFNTASDLVDVLVNLK